MRSRLLRLGVILGLNAVPGVGFFLAGWSGSTALILYWWENFFGSLLIAILIVVHRKLTRERSDSPDQKTFAAFRANSLSNLFVFTIGHGIFLAAILFVISQDQHVAMVNAMELRPGLLGMTGFLLAGFYVDLIGLGDRSFAWLKRIGDFTFGRVLVVHLTIIFGGAAYVFFGRVRALLAVFIGLKLLLDLAWWWPSPAKTVPDWTDLRITERPPSP